MNWTFPLIVGGPASGRHIVVPERESTIVLYDVDPRDEPIPLYPWAPKAPVGATFATTMYHRQTIRSGLGHDVHYFAPGGSEAHNRAMAAVAYDAILQAAALGAHVIGRANNGDEHAEAVLVDARSRGVAVVR